METLADELADSGRDTWLIEITGGPNIECDDCINYNYTDLVDDFWPALIGAVQKQTGKDKIQYVAHSNGCRTALDSLSSWSSTGKVNVGKVIYNGNEIEIDMLSNPVDTFVGVACPGNFSELSYFGRIVNNSGALAITRLNNNNVLHPTFGQVAHELESIGGEIVSIIPQLRNTGISLNLFRQYYEWINKNDDKPAGSISLDYFSLVYGSNGFGFDNTNDYIVPINDETGIFNKVNSSNKVFREIFISHFGMANNRQVQSIVRDSLDKSIYR